MLAIKRRDRRGQQRERKGGVDVEYQRIFPALMQPDGLLFQFAGGVQHVAPLFQQHLPGTGKARPVTAAVEKLNIEIAFQLMNGIAQRRGRFIELRRGGGKAALFIEGIKDDEHIQQWFHRSPLRYAIHRWRITPSASPADRGTDTQTPVRCKYGCHPRSCRYRSPGYQRIRGREAQARGPSADKRRRARDA